MAKLRTLAADAAKEKEGVWVPYADGVEFKIARAKNKEFRAKLMTIIRGLRRKQKKFERVSDPDAVNMVLQNADEFRESIAPAVASHILLGWKNVEDDDGKPMEYTPEKGTEILSDNTYEDVLTFILEVSNESELYRAEETAEDAKNS